MFKCNVCGKITKSREKMHKVAALFRGGIKCIEKI